MTWHPIGFLAERIVDDVAKRRAKPSYKQPDYLELHRITRDPLCLVEYERQAQKDQIR